MEPLISHVLMGSQFCLGSEQVLTCGTTWASVPGTQVPWAGLVGTEGPGNFTSASGHWSHRGWPSPSCVAQQLKKWALFSFLGIHGAGYVR